MQTLVGMGTKVLCKDPRGDTEGMVLSGFLTLPWFSPQPT